MRGFMRRIRGVGWGGAINHWQGRPNQRNLSINHRLRLTRVMHDLGKMPVIPVETGI